MPLPMVHLAIAVELAASQDRFPTAPFLLGSIAPDSIHMRPDASRTDKDATHLANPPDTPEHMGVQALFKQDSRTEGFTAGYAAHLLTDRLWKTEIITSLESQIPVGMDEAAIRNLYYQETDQADFNLYHNASWRPEIWKLLTAAEAVDFPPLLSAGEIAAWRDRTLCWFEELKEEPGITPQYITDVVVDQFIHEATEYVETYFSAWGVSSDILS